MRLKITTSILALTILCFSSNAQETKYKTVKFAYDVPPSIIFDGPAYTSYDVRLYNNEKNELYAKTENGFDLGIQKFQLVENNGDLHVISLLQRFVPKTPFSKIGGVMTADVAVYTQVISRSGNTLYAYQYTNQAYNLKYTADETSESITTKTLQAVVASSLTNFKNQISGLNTQLETKLAYLDDVKKIPELKAMEDNAKELKNVLESGGISAFKTNAVRFLPEWQKSAEYTGKEENEVKRAAYQNIALYYILINDFDKANEILEKYKPIDKTVKEMFGLYKYKNSENLDSLMNMMLPAKKVINTTDVTSIATATDALDKVLYYTINGTVELNGKKNTGSYTGTIKIKYPLPELPARNGIIDLDRKDISLTINGTSNGQVTNVDGGISQIVSMKDSENKSYTVTKQGSTYILMRETYSSPKISIFRILIPTGNDFLVRKSGDDKGYKTSYFNAKKNLISYLSDCPNIAEPIKQAKDIYDYNTIEKIVKDYSNCN